MGMCCKINRKIKGVTPVKLMFVLGAYNPTWTSYKYLNLITENGKSELFFSCVVICFD